MRKGSDPLQGLLVVGLLAVSLSCDRGVVKVALSGKRVVARGSRAQWSPDGRSIAFLNRVEPRRRLPPPVGARGRRFGGELSVVSADGRGDTRVLTDGVQVVSFSWSPDSRRLAFVVYKDAPPCPDSERAGCGCFFWPDGDGELGVVSADGRGDVRILTQGARVRQFLWSPDSREIIFETIRFQLGPDSTEVQLQNSPDSVKLQVVALDDGRTRTVRGPYAWHDISLRDWCWLGDGSVALAEYRREANWTYWSFIDPVDGANVRPTGKEKLFYWLPDTLRREVRWMRNADSTGPVRLVNPDWPDAEISEVAWSSATGRLAATLSSRTRSQVAVTDAQARTWRVVADGAESPTWSPEGKWLMFRKESRGTPDIAPRLNLVSADGRYQGVMPREVDFAPSGGRVTYTDEDGTIAVARLKVRRKLW